MRNKSRSNPEDVLRVMDSKTAALKRIHRLCNECIDNSNVDLSDIKKVREIASAYWPELAYGDEDRLTIRTAEAAQDSPEGLVFPPHCAEELAKLREILKDVQGKIHDQWDWMEAEFAVEVLRCGFADALRRAIEAEERVQELEECLIVAGTVRDASYPSGWRNFRAESAEAKVQELEADAMKRAAKAGVLQFRAESAEAKVADLQK